MTPKVNKDLCIGCGTCAAICPDVFEIGPDGKAQVKAADFTGKEALISQAKDACAVQAITIE